MKLQRDIFLGEVYNLLKVDKSIYVLSADFGAAALDAIREEFKDNFILVRMGYLMGASPEDWH